MDNINDFINNVLNEGAYKFILSGKRDKNNGLRRISFTLLDGEGAFFIEKFTEKQAFHSRVSIQNAADELIRCFSDFIQINAWNHECEFTAKLSKKGKLLTGKHKNTSAPERQEMQNREKSYLISEGCIVPPLVDMGVMNSSGYVKKPMFDKFRQINRFLEFIDDAVKDDHINTAVNNDAINDDTTANSDAVKDDTNNTAANGDDPKSATANGDIFTIVDFGCGKSYLTFIVYYYFTVIKHMRIRMIGIDLKKDVIDFCTGLAKKYGYNDMHFIAGDIADFTMSERIDMVISLHACDTATDYALFHAIMHRAKYILSVPCCQHEIAKNANLECMPVFDDDGILRERISSLLTDGVRAKLLTACGYKTQLMEFVDLSHTPKNILIRAKMGELSKDKRNHAQSVAHDCLTSIKCEQTLYTLLTEAGILSDRTMGDS